MSTGRLLGYVTLALCCGSAGHAAQARWLAGEPWPIIPAVIAVGTLLALAVLGVRDVRRGRLT